MRCEICCQDDYQYVNGKNVIINHDSKVKSFTCSNCVQILLSKKNNSKSSEIGNDILNSMPKYQRKGIKVLKTGSKAYPTKG